MTKTMPFLQKYDITFLRPPTIPAEPSFMLFAYSSSVFNILLSLEICKISDNRTHSPTIK